MCASSELQHRYPSSPPRLQGPHFSGRLGSSHALESAFAICLNICEQVGARTLNGPIFDGSHMYPAKRFHSPPTERIPKGPMWIYLLDPQDFTPNRRSHTLWARLEECPARGAPDELSGRPRTPNVREQAKLWITGGKRRKSVHSLLENCSQLFLAISATHL